MILFKKELSQTTLILPSIPYEYTDVKLVLHSDFSNKDFTIPLLDDLAIHPQRNSQFLITSDRYSTLEDGLYQYEILADTNIISIGMARVQSSIPVLKYTSIPTINDSIEDDDYQVFN
jgi:hypothetical protein